MRGARRTSVPSHARGSVVTVYGGVRCPMPVWRGATPPPRCAREYRRNPPFAAPCSLPHRCSTPLLHTAAAHHAHRCCTPRAMPCTRRRCCASSGRWRATSRRAACGRSAGRRAATSISRCSRGSCSRSRHGHLVHGSHNPISREYPSSSIPVELYLVSEHQLSSSASQPKLRAYPESGPPALRCRRPSFGSSPTAAALLSCTGTSCSSRADCRRCLVITQPPQGLAAC